jgi:hypothetical protein
MNGETDLSEDSAAASSDGEPAVPSYAQFRNRECLLAWRERRIRHEAASDANGAVPVNRTVGTPANVLARGT